MTDLDLLKRRLETLEDGVAAMKASREHDESIEQARIEGRARGFDDARRAATEGWTVSGRLYKALSRRLDEAERQRPLPKP